MICKMLVIRKIMLKNEQQNNAHSNAQGKPENVEYGKEFILEENPDKKLEVSLKHSLVVRYLTDGLAL